MAFEGAQTFNTRQSSEPESPPLLSAWAQIAPKRVASRLSLHGVGDSGARHRSGPMGGFAKGMPTHSLTPLASEVPMMGPELVVKSGGASNSAAATVAAR